MLQEALSDNDIDYAQQLCLKWRQQVIQLFGTTGLQGKKLTNVNFPNFHAILHVFDQAKEYGPPVLWWTRPFEHKHTTFRGYIQRSNKQHGCIQWSINKEIQLETFRYMYPELFKIHSPIRKGWSKSLVVGDHVVVLKENELFYAKVMSSALKYATHITVKLFSFEKAKQSKLLDCLIFSSLKLDANEISVPRGDVLSRFSVVHDYVNKYEVLGLNKL